jgi:hypothetical protein
MKQLSLSNPKLSQTTLGRIWGLDLGLWQTKLYQAVIITIINFSSELRKLFTKNFLIYAILP